MASTSRLKSPESTEEYSVVVAAFAVLGLAIVFGLATLVWFLWQLSD